MTDDERELLKQVAGLIGAVSAALANGAGMHDFAAINRSGLEAIGPLFERVYAPQRAAPTEESSP